jgi:hypothetical protein
MDQLVALVVDESKWLTVSMSLAMLVSSLLLYRHRESVFPTRRRILVAMNLFFAITIGVMAFGHLSAVSTKLALGTLKGSVPLLYVIGIALAVPSWLFIYHMARFMGSNIDFGRKTLIFNGWLAITLIVLGVHNLPLAVPGLLNISYQLNSGRVTGWMILCLAILVNLGLFIGSVLFFASGQSFEQFRGIQ